MTLILLDTCTFLWLSSDQEKLSPRARQLIAGAAGSLFISSISAFEISLKHRKGRLTLPLEPDNWIEEALAFHGVEDVPVDWRIACRSASIPMSHGDPCDRIILATAQEKGLTLLTPDPVLRSYPGASVDW